MHHHTHTVTVHCFASLLSRLCPALSIRKPWLFGLPSGNPIILSWMMLLTDTTLCTLVSQLLLWSALDGHLCRQDGLAELATTGQRNDSD